MCTTNTKEMTMRQRAFNRVLFLGLFAVGLLGTRAVMAGDETIVYFTRHGEDMVTSECWGDPDDPCCTEILNPVGELRAQLLADWFAKEGITEELTHILATHKTRTRQTVRHIAEEAGLPGGGDANPDDGIEQVPNIDPETGEFITECTPGYESSKSTRGPMLNAILDIHESEEDAVILAAGHSPQLYWVMMALGIDTSDDITFPKKCKNEDHDPPCDNIDKNERVNGFNNVWIVIIDEDGTARLDDHRVFSFELEDTSTVKVKDK
jgi:broad specificity phosphatase PhoE